jgi:GNAT superfamily N-acetyltransferase
MAMDQHQIGTSFSTGDEPLPSIMGSMTSTTGRLGAQAEPVTLFDGTQAAIRFIEPSDAAALVRFHSQLSPATIQMRFFSPHLTLTNSEVQRFVNVDGTDRVALVVEVGSDIVAVGRFDRMADTTGAEVAFVVTDEHQHHGLGALLLAKLAGLARERGIATFVAETLDCNRAMPSVFRESGFPMKASSSWGVVDVILDIATAEPTN